MVEKREKGGMGGGRPRVRNDEEEEGRKDDRRHDKTNLKDEE